MGRNIAKSLCMLILIPLPFIVIWFAMNFTNASTETPVVILGIFMVVWLIFGWRVLDGIQPVYFLWLPLIGWFIYLSIKASISVMVGMFAFPLAVSNKIADLFE